MTFYLLDCIVVLTLFGLVVGVASRHDFETGMSLAFLPGTYLGLRMWQRYYAPTTRTITGALLVGGLTGAAGSAVIGCAYLLCLASTREEFWQTSLAAIAFVLILRAVFHFVIGSIEGSVFGVLFYVADKLRTK
jgi:hypothetical protein